MRRAGFNNKGFKQCYTSASACSGLHQSPSPRGSLVTHRVCFEFQTWFSDFIGLLRKKDPWIQENSGIVGDWEWLFTNNKMSGNLKVRLVHCPALAPDGTERIWKWGVQRCVTAWQTEKCAWPAHLSQTHNTTASSPEGTPRRETATRTSYYHRFSQTWEQLLLQTKNTHEGGVMERWGHRRAEKPPPHHPKKDVAEQPRAKPDTWRNTALHHGVWKHFPFISSPFDSRTYKHTLSSVLTRQFTFCRSDRHLGSTPSCFSWENVDGQIIYWWILGIFLNMFSLHSLKVFTVRNVFVYEDLNTGTESNFQNRRSN